MSKNVASRFSVLSKHCERTYSVKAQKELMQFDCTTCLISYFMKFLRFMGKHKVRLFVVGVENCTYMVSGVKC